MTEPDVERCEFLHVHQDIVEAVQQQMPEEERLYDLAELYKVFGDSTRIKILYVLFEAEMCVCDIAQLLSMSQSAISHQLRVLKQSRLVKYRRDGKDGVLLFGGRPCAGHFGPGDGSCNGITVPRLFLIHIRRNEK